MSDSLYDPDSYPLFFPCARDASSGQIRELIEDGFDQMWSTSLDGDTDGVLYHGPANDYQTERYPMAEAIDHFVGENGGAITIFDGDLDLSLSRVPSINHRDSDDVGGFRISVDRVHFNRALKRDDDDVISPLLETATYVFERLPSAFAFSRIPNDLEYETEVTRNHVTEPRLPDVYWLTLLSDTLCESIGYERLETAPVWKAKALDGGGFGLVVTEHPFDYTDSDKAEVREHLGLTERGE